MARLTPQNEQRVKQLQALYPQARSALIPSLHVLQAQDGYLSEDGMEHLGELFGLASAEVRGTASFYDMFHTEPVGKYLVAVCTNVACLLQGAYELLEHATERLGVAPGGTTGDGLFTLEDAECLALCGNAPCLTVNWRFFGDVSLESFDHLVDDLAAGKLEEEVPAHGTLSRVERSGGLAAAGLSVNGAGGPLGAAAPAAPATAPTTPLDPARLENRYTTSAVVSLDGGRARQPLDPQTPLPSAQANGAPAPAPEPPAAEPSAPRRAPRTRRPRNSNPEERP